MKKALIALISAAAFVLTSCSSGKSSSSGLQAADSRTEKSSSAVSSSSKDKNLPKSSYKDLNEEDKKHVDSAKSVINDWFSYMSKAEYSKANTLCTRDFIRRFHFDEFTDGENASKATAEFYDDALEVSEDSQGNVIISVKTKSVSHDSSKSSTYGIFQILYKDGTYLLANIGDSDQAGSNSGN